MKRPAPVSSPSCSGSPGFAWRWRWPLALLAAGIGLAPIALRAGLADQLEVGVRAGVVDKTPEGLATASVGSRIYGILALQLIPGEEKMVRPVNLQRLLGLVHRELEAHGFREVQKGLKPEILLTVQYGRAWLHNPYFGDEQTKDQGGGAPARNVTVATATDSRQTVAGWEGKAQKAQYEKLCIKIIAWEYPPDPKAKAKLLWHTTMIVDDPAHRDLNVIAGEMLAAGSPYFGHELLEEEVEVTRPLPEGHVKIGTPEVVEAPPSKK